jgi:hypothetical protein
MAFAQHTQGFEPFLATYRSAVAAALPAGNCSRSTALANPKVSPALGSKAAFTAHRGIKVTLRLMAANGWGTT